MNFLEKNLEDIIWQYPAQCIERGLDALNYSPELGGKHYRQLNLAPYGIADLVSVYYNAQLDTCWIQVIECKRGKVDAETYMQAKRYAASMMQFLGKSAVPPKDMVITIMLVGASVDASSSLAFAIAQDTKCVTYTYEYGVDGIRFNRACDIWRERLFVEHAACVEETFWDIEFYRIGQFGKLQEAKQRNGDLALPLLVGASGVYLNYSLLDQELNAIGQESE